MDCQSIARLAPCNSLGFPKNLPVPIYFPGWRELIFTLREKLFAKEHNTLTRPGLRPRPLHWSPAPNYYKPLCVPWKNSDLHTFLLRVHIQKQINQSLKSGIQGIHFDNKVKQHLLAILFSCCPVQNLYSI